MPEGDAALDRVARGMVSRIYKDVYADLRAMEAAIARSATDWTVVRPPKLLNRPVSGMYRVAVGGTPPRARSLGRADVAHAMLVMVGDVATVKQGVGLAY
ncbi:hypothetical protein GCM10010234_36120 [Streptomyces hawaiiensis]